MNISQILYAVKLSEYRNFTAAAAELFITQSTLSLQIKKLEEELGLTLFIRDKNGLKLTDAGKDFINYGRKVLADLDNLKTGMENYSGLLKGELRIGLLWTFGSTDIGNIIHRFIKKYPNIKVTFLFDGSASLVKKLNYHEIDVAFITKNISKPTDSNLDIKLIDESNMMLIVNKSHPLADKKYVKFEDLEGENLMMTSKYSNMFHEFFNNLNLDKSNINIIGYTSIAEISYQVVKYGFGVSFMSSSSFNKINTGSDDVVSIPLHPAVKRSIDLISLKESQNNRIIMAFKNLAFSDN